MFESIMNIKLNYSMYIKSRELRCNKSDLEYKFPESVGNLITF